MSIVWLFAPQYPLAVLPYCIYSVFHTLVYTRQNLIPTVQPPQPAAAGEKPPAHPVAEIIGNFVKRYYEASMSVVSSLELLLWLRLMLSALSFSRSALILFGLYTAFLRTRFAQSAHVQNSFAQLEAHVDSLAANQHAPPAVRQVWEGIKGGVRQFHNVTDVSQYTSGAAAPKKTS